jgi:hypothetical protein
MSVASLADPRTFPAARIGDPALATRYALAQAAIDASTGNEADTLDATLREWLRTSLTSPGGALESALANAPSVAVGRHLRRLLADIEQGDDAARSKLRTTLFAMPLILVAALEPGTTPVTLPGVLPQATLAAVLRDARAFGGCETFAISPSLVATGAIDIAALPALLAHAHLEDDTTALVRDGLDVAPAPIAVETLTERTHLRYVTGAVLTPPHLDPLRESAIARWGIPLSQALTKALRAPQVTLLALPRPPERLVNAVQAGRAAQREVSAQVFASNAIRKLRASFGEPTAVLSAHRDAAAPGGGELRLSLSSPFATREAEGFRCPVYPYETVGDVATMLDTLLRDCRVADVRVMSGVHPDIDTVTGGPLFFKGSAAIPVR